MDLNHLKAKLFKAEMREDKELIEEYKKQIEEFEKNNPNTPQPWQARARENRPPYLPPEDRKALNQLKDELNSLSSKKLKAEMLGKTDECDEYQAKIEEHKRKLEDFEEKLTLKQADRSAPSQPTPERSIQQQSRPIPERPVQKRDKCDFLQSFKKETKVSCDYANLLAECKKEMDELRSRQQGNPRIISIDPKRAERTEKLNLLNERLVKAKMYGQDQKVQELKAEIAKLTEEVNEEDDQEYDERTRKQLEDEKKMVDRLNELSAKLVKAELRNDERMVEECKREIDVYTKEAEKARAANQPVELDFDFIEVFERLVQANKVNDKRQIDTCKSKIEEFEGTFNFKHRGDLEKLVSLSGVALEETMKVKGEKEMNGDLQLANDLDKRAKAIRKKNIEYTARLEEVIAAEPRKERVFKSRVHPLYGKPEWKTEPKEEPESRTIQVIKKIKEENLSLGEMFVREKNAGTDSEDARFINAGSRMRSADDEYEETAKAKRRKRNAASEYQTDRVEDKEEQCDDCLEKTKDRLLIAYDVKAFMLIPEREPMIEHQLIIRSTEHCPSLVMASEDVLEVVNQFKQKLCAVFASTGKQLIFIEYHLKSMAKWKKHLELICYPIDEDLLENSKMFFMKGINDTGSEWATNRKLISLDGQPIGKKVAKEISYFCVTFGPSNDGFAHRIEDRQSFSRYFGEEILGGVLDIDQLKWVKPAMQSYKQQEERSAALKKLWNKFEVFTK